MVTVQKGGEDGVGVGWGTCEHQRMITRASKHFRVVLEHSASMGLECSRDHRSVRSRVRVRTFLRSLRHTAKEVRWQA